MLEWFKSYLSGRSQVTKFGQETSDSADITIGLPQGSVLGAVLFNIFINDLVNATSLMNPILFCDDSTLFVSGKNLNELVETANRELLLISEWCLSNKMSLNSEETVAMFLSNRRVRNCPPIILKNGFNFDVVKRVESVKFLGIYYDQQMKFKRHISYLTTKLSRTAGMLYRLSQFLPAHILKKVYFTRVNSFLSYNTPIWACNYINNIKPLLQVQKKIIRIITKSDFLAHSKPLFKKSKVLNLVDLNKLYMGKIFHNNPGKYIEPFRLNHQHNTRNVNDLRPPRFLSTLAQNSFFVQGPLNYNNLPANIKEIRSPVTFKKKLKEHLLSEY